MVPLSRTTRLRRLRLTVGLTQRDLAEILGIGVSRLAAAERGRDVLRPAEQRRLAEVLGAPSVAWLLYLGPQPPEARR